MSTASLALFISTVASAADVTEAFRPIVQPFSSTASLPVPVTPDQAAMRAWKISLGSVFASQALDVTSSYGMRELNPILAGPDRRFGVRGATIKLGAAAGALGVEYWMVRKHPQMARVFTRINWSASVVPTIFAVHNFAIR